MKDAFFYFLLFSIMLCICFFSCTPEKKHLDANDLKIIDSLTIQQKKIIGHEIDSLCDLNFEQKLQPLVDSILEKRLLEIKRIIESDL